ncbi:hypothetical protein [Pedobacter gandavensis]|uniref:Lipoprotein n=1 Tax=Pedobacter gandavensis TaxID=2679963 RepID=A0ABR6EW33_9SPHI|nr:hypothetical protein [Pedobacter gandavensis]MBB2148648.1 hypothetical protein [Pedobacter gandavensis]
MNKLLLFFCLLLIFACGDARKKQTNTTADTLASKAKGHVESGQKDTVQSGPTKKEKPEAEAPDQINDEMIQKAIVYRSDSSLNMFENIRADYRIFGYQAPDTNSRKLLLVSVFTKDVEGNPYHCDYGSYYYSGAMEDTQIKFVKRTGDFVEANLIKDKVILTPIFFHKSWVEFKD